MLKLYFGNHSAIISTLLLLGNFIYILLGYANSGTIQKWGISILLLIILNGVYWYFANVRDLYSNSIISAIDKSAEGGLFSVSSIQSLIYWLTSIIIWLCGLAAIFKPQYRRQIFYIITIAAFIQIGFIEASRIALYNRTPQRFNYM